MAVSESAPDTLVDAAYLQLADFTDGVPNPTLQILLADHIARAAAAGQMLTIAQAAKEFGIAIPAALHVVRPEAREWALEYAAELVAQVSDETRRGIAQKIADGIWRQRGVDGTGRDIRADLLANDIGKDLGRYAGLNSQRIQHMEKYEVELIEAGFSGKDLERRLDAEAGRQLRKRAQTIAQTEMRNSMARSENIEKRAVGMTRKKWNTQHDDRVDEGQCRPNEGQGWIPVEDSFQSGHDAPTAHPRCRCNLLFEGMTRETLASRLQALGVE